MNRSAKDFVAIVELAEGNHEYKFNVDGEWINDPNSPVVETSQGKIDTSLYDVTNFSIVVTSHLKCKEIRAHKFNLMKPYFF